MPLTAAAIRQIEEIHTPIEKLILGANGEDCEWVDVCEACDSDDGQYAVLFPCETLIDAQQGTGDYEQA